MEPLFAMLGVIVALVAGLAVGWILAHRSHAPLRTECDDLRQRCGTAEAGSAVAEERARQGETHRLAWEQVARERDQFAHEAATLRPVADRAGQLEREIVALREEKEALAAAKAAFERGEAERQRAHQAQLEQLEGRFAELAGKAVQGAHEAFLQRAGERMAHEGQQNEAKLKALLQPVETTLKRYEQKLETVEKDRVDSYAGLREQVSALHQSHAQAQTATLNLVNALRSSPKARGRWGEQSLKNVLEQAGLSPYADYQAEVSVDTGEGRLRPDVVVRLPGGRQLIIDAKCSLNAFLDANDEADEATRATHLKAHAASIRRHAEQLGSKAYWQQFGDAADYVVMYIPGEHFLTAALEQDGGLWDWAYERRVLLATPTNLVAIARTVATVWRQEKLAETAAEVAALGKELHKRIQTMSGHVGTLGNNLRLANEAYNKFVGSMETKVLPQARRFESLNVVEGREIESLPMVEANPRPLTKLAPPEPLAAG